MKFKILLFLVFISHLAQGACKNGDNIYTTYLGTTNFWGDVYPVWSSANVVTIFNGSGAGTGNNTPSCGQVVPSGFNDTGGTCWIATGIPPNNTQDGIVNWGGNATITTSYTACPVANLPFDDYIPVLVFLTGSIGFYYIKSKRSIILSQP